MTLPDPIALIEAGGVPYSQIREQIAPGDLIFLHHGFIKDWIDLSLYDKQIYFVQRFTGPIAHIGILDRIRVQDGQDRVVVYESVVNKPRAVRLSTTAEQGFFWLPLNRPMTPEAREAIWSALGFGEYSKWGAVRAGLGWLPKDELSRSRMWCAKWAYMMAALYGVELHPSFIPTEQCIDAQLKFNKPLRYVRMAND